MELKLFTDLNDALGKVSGGLEAIVILPKAKREAIRRTLDKTYRLVGTTVNMVNMVIIRLGDILLHTADDPFLREAARFDYCSEWMQAEREFRLCRSLRVALRETQTLAGKLSGAVGTKDWDALLQDVQAILATEGEAELLIGQQSRQLVNNARSAGQDSEKSQPIRDGLSAFRMALISERQEQIKKELTLYAIV